MTHIGINEFPDHWGVGVGVIDNGGKVRVTLETNDQADQLQEIEIIGEEDPNPIATIQADGSYSYDLDLSQLVNGVYSVKLDFWPGFYLSKTLIKTPDRETE